MIDAHCHLWTTDTSSPGKRADRATQFRREADALDIDRICLIGDFGDTVAECREYNRTVAKYVAEHPDLFYGWAVVDPRLGDEGIAEFRRAVEEDGLVGLKHHSNQTDQPCSAPEMEPFAEACVEMDVPMIVHATHRNPAYLEANNPNETQTEHVVELAQKYPDLRLISGHIGAGGDWERRIKNIADQENVYLDTSGTNCERGQLEMSVERLGADRIVFGTDTWLVPGTGKLIGSELSSDEKATIAYNFERLLGENVPNKLDDEELEAREERARERFERDAKPVEEAVVDANAFVGAWPFRDVEASATNLIELMDHKGVDRALVSSVESVFYRNPHAGNRKLAVALESLDDAVPGEASREDRLISVATIDPTYPAWREDLDECLDEYGMQAVKLLPLYHDYAIDDPAVSDLLEHCADRSVPVVFAATLEDQRQRHTRVELRDGDDIFRDSWADQHVDELVAQLKFCPETDVVIADAWTSAADIREELTEVRPQGVRLDNRVRSGETLFVLDDLFMFFTYQGQEIADDVGVDHLVCGPQLPFKVFESYYQYVEHLPIDDSAKDQVRSENVLSLLE